MTEKRLHIVAVFVLFAVAGVARLIPHIPNFTPTEGVTLFGAAYLGRKYFAFLLPVLMLYITDLVLNNTINRSFFTESEGIVWFSNYMIYGMLSIAFIVLMGSGILKKITIFRVGGAALGSAVIFFIISNFGVWLHSAFYTRDIAGITQCYIAAWPFFRTTLISNLLFTALLFGGYELFLRRFYASLKHEKQA